MRIGLLGGSFNPAHAGHLHLSRHALGRLGLDRVWWLVAPQNPLKPADGMAPLASRLAAARALAAADPRIEVSAIETELGTRYTVETVAALQARFPEHRFVLLLGADLMVELPRWRAWRRLMRAVPVAVFARAPYSFRAQSARAARTFSGARRSARRARRIAERKPPIWVFVKMPRCALSATRIRAGRAVPAGPAS